MALIIKPSSRLKKGWFYYWLLDNWLISSGEFTGQKYSFERYPFLIDVAKDDSPMIVAMKSAQLGFTELMTARLFATADLLPGNLLYVLPTDDLAKNLARGRIRNAPYINPYLEQRLSGFDTLQQFRFKSNYIYIRGSQTQIKDGRTYQRQLISLDITKLFGDEVDEWNAGVFPKLQSRLGAATDPYACYFTTPRLPDGEMARLFNISDQKYWGIKCRRCGYWNIPLELEENVENFEYPDMPHPFVCKKCRRSMDRLEQERTHAQWIAQNPDSGKHSGYHFSKLFFQQADIDTIVERYNNPETQTECFNDDLGLPHQEKEYKIDDDVLKKVMAPDNITWSDWKASAQNKRMGVDIGKKLHVTIRADGPHGKDVVLDIFSCSEFAELKHYCYQENVKVGICDAQPDFRASLQFCEEMSVWGDFRVAYYDNWNQTAKEKVLVREETSNEFVITIARNLAMSKVMFDIVSGQVLLPIFADTVDSGDFFQHMKEPRRIYRRDERTGQTVVFFPPTRKPDHFFHSMVYSRCAEEISMSQVQINYGGGMLI